MSTTTVVKETKKEEPRSMQGNNFMMDVLDAMDGTYKVNKKVFPIPTVGPTEEVREGEEVLGKLSDLFSERMCSLGAHYEMQKLLAVNALFPEVGTLEEAYKLYGNLPENGDEARRYREKIAPLDRKMRMARELCWDRIQDCFPEAAIRGGTAEPRKGWFIIYSPGES